MKALHIISALETEAAGPSYSVRRLAESARGEGVASAIYTTKPPGAPAPPHVEAFDLTPWGNSVGRALYASAGLRRALEVDSGPGDILHSHGLWLLPNLYPAWAARKSGAKLISSPRGMLAAQAMAFSRAKKRLMWSLAQQRALQSAACLHATSEMEAQDIRESGLVNPIAIVANGIDVPTAPTPRRPHPDGLRTVLHLGRLHPKKGIDQLLLAWGQVEARHPGWRLRIVGPSEAGHDEDLKALTQRLGLQRVQFDAAMFGPDKAQAYDDADIFVLPTRSENFGLVVAEALAAGAPVICTKGAPWEGLERHQCGWWIDYGAQALAATFDTALRLDAPTLSAMGQRGRAWMQSDFSWTALGEKMRAVYRWMWAQGPQPAFVHLD